MSQENSKSFFQQQVHKLQGQTVQAMQAVGFQGHACPIEIAAEGTEAMAAWIGQYDELRARAEVGELAKAVHQKSFLQSTQTSGRSLTAEVKRCYRNGCRSTGHGPNRTSDVVLQADREEIPQTSADAMDAFRRKVDDEFGWQNKELSAKWPLFRGAQQVGVEQPNHLLAEWCKVGDCWDDCWMTSCQNLF